MRTILMILLSMAINLSFGQSDAWRSEASADSLSTSQNDSKDTLLYNFNYNQLTHLATAPVLQLNATKFNQGNISDPLQLIQGKFSGLLIARAGNDPNEGFSARVRGISSLYMSSSPLILVDGMPASSLLGVDPFDIQRVTLVKDAASASAFGLRSLGGVLLFDTYQGKQQKLIVRHYTSIEAPNDESKQVLNAKEYIGAGGANVGSETNWYKEITRRALSNATHISYGDAKGNTEYYASLNYRSTDGVLKNSGFTNLNGRFKVKQTFFDERLSLGAQLSLTERKSMFSFVEAFKYSKIYNPTAPVFNQTGGYYETVLFDYFNPVAMVQQNVNDGILNISNFGINAAWNISPSFQIKGMWAKESEKNEVRKYWSKESLWIGKARNGLRSQDNQGLKTNFGSLSASYSKSIRATLVNIRANYSTQGINVSKEFIEAGNFMTEESGRASVYNSSDLFNGFGVKILNFYESKKINSFYSSLAFNSNDIFYFDANLCSENIDMMRGITYGVSSGVNLTGKNASVQLKPRIGYGVSSGALSFFQNYSPENILHSWQLLWGIKDLKPENKAELNVGLDWSIFKQKLSGSFNFFSATTTNAIAPAYIVSPGIVTTTLKNNSKIKNRGAEINLNWNVVERDKVSISTNLNFSTIRNTFRTNQPGGYSYDSPEFVIGNLGSLNVKLTDGNPIGQVNGYTYQGIENGKWVLLDIDKNGFYNSNDQNTFSKPLPSSFLGWTTILKAGRFKTNMLFRGAFGHTLFNVYRLGYENPQAMINRYNAPTTLLNSDIKTLQESNVVSDFYSETASYFKLDNISVFYDFFLSGNHKIVLTAFLTGQNLFTFSKYQGNNPEVRLGYNESQMMPGFDSQFTYASSRTYLMGIEIKI